MTRASGKYWDTINNIWINDVADSFTYDGRNNMLSLSYYWWDLNQGMWQLQQNEINTYDSIDRKTTSTQPQGGNRYTYLYDSKSNIKSILTEWNAPITWHNVYLANYTYDANNNNTNILQQVYDTTGNLNNMDQRVYTFDANNNNTGEIYQVWNDYTKAWDNKDGKYYTYNAHNKITSETFEEWDINSKAWINHHRYKFTYDVNDNIVQAITQTWNSSGKWENASASYRTYDMQNNNLTSTEQYYDTKTNTWVNTSEYISNTYDANNYKISILDHRSSNDSTHYYYRTNTTAVNSITEPVKKLYIYPNPSSEMVTIQYSTKQKEALNIYNMLGEMVYTENWQQGQTERTINVAAFSKGIYIIKLGESIQKLVVE